ncbi:MAG: PD-(D/E)XK nuclease family protein [Acidobacteria bacterium]|nr:PD-(D/E)XK nuclease family protein [Acidobacteriota bacterium]
MYEVPQSLSPSRVDAFLSCPMAFRFASIERLPEPPSVHTTKGSLVHRALELLFTHPNRDRTLDTARHSFERAMSEYSVHPDFTLLGLDDSQQQAFRADAWTLVEAYFAMEDPTQVRDIGLELRLEAKVDTLALRGIIDRLELDADGHLVVTDYKTGRSPGAKYEQSRLAGVHFYSFLCQEVLGERPAAIRLMYLRSGEVITATPTAQTVKFLTTRTTAVWRAVEKACQTGDFRPKQGPLCNSCSFRDWCPAFGGRPELAATEAPLRVAPPPAA